MLGLGNVLFNGGDASCREGSIGGEGGFDMSTFDVDDDSDSNRSASTSNGFSSSKASMMARSKVRACSGLLGDARADVGAIC